MRKVAVFCILASGSLLGQPAFLRKDIPFHSPFWAVAGDFNGDRRPDLAVYSWYEGLVVFLNDGRGDLRRPIRTGVEMQAWRLGLPLVADLNGDGKDDLVTGDGLLISRGDGTFEPGAKIPTVLTVADFDGDGKNDLVVFSPGGSTRVLLGNGDGTFRAGASISSFSGLGVAADFNRDGRKDVAFASPPGIVWVFLGNGDGTFGPEIRASLNSNGGLVLAAADLNGDGAPDLIGDGAIALGNGDGSFQAPLRYPDGLGADLPGAVRFLAAADFTGDGKIDVAVVRVNSNSVLLLPGKGDGTFLPPIEFATGWGATPGTALDLDGDGRLDLITANSGSNTLTLLLARKQQSPDLRRAVSAASGTAIVAPESLATLFVSVPVSAMYPGAPPWPPRIAGIGLDVRDSTGVTRPAPLQYVGPNQLNFQVPAGTALGEATLSLVSDRGTTVAGGMQVEASAAALFMLPSPGFLTPAATAMRVEADGTQTPLPVFNCSPSPQGVSCKQSPIPLSTAGDRPIYLTFYGTGFRGASAEIVKASITGVSVPVTSAGPQVIPGVDQINIRLLPYADLANMGYEVVISFGGIAANTVYIDLQ